MTFPVLNALHILTYQRNDSKESKHNAVAPHWAAELFGRYLRQGTYVVLTVLTYIFAYPLEEAKKHPLGGPVSLWLPWVMTVFLRNYVIMVLTYGFWQWFLYDSSFAKPLREDGKKFNKQMPDTQQLRREQFYTTLGFTMSSVYEVVMLHLFASGTVTYMSDAELLASPIWSLFHFLFVIYWRDTHFYFIHRFMHPWRFKVLGVDPGKFIYKHVHSLHHKSVNPTTWSGLSMSPWEHLLYYTCTLTPLVFTLHPMHFLMNKFHADVSPAPGHDGFGAPAGGSLFHYLHHAHFECNYGTPLVALDVLFGTYEDGSRWNKPTKATQ